MGVLRIFKSKFYTKRIINKNMKTKIPIDCEKYIHNLDKAALVTLKKIPLLDTVSAKIISVLNDKQTAIINMSTKIHITDKQIPKIYHMVESICKKIGIVMPDLYLQLDRDVNAYTYGTEKFTIVINSGLIECLEDDEIYAVLAHECGHIACKHGLYHTIGNMIMNSGMIGLQELAEQLSGKGIISSVAGNIISMVDSSLELAFYHWYRCSELSADRVAVICCGTSKPVIETMMRLAGGTTHIDAQVNRDLFISQADEYKHYMDNNLINKGLEFLLTKNDTHPLLSVRAYEAKLFEESEDFKCLK